MHECYEKRHDSIVKRPVLLHNKNVLRVIKKCCDEDCKRQGKDYYLEFNLEEIYESEPQGVKYPDG